MFHLTGKTVYIALKKIGGISFCVGITGAQSARKPYWRFLKVISLFGPNMNILLTRMSRGLLNDRIWCESCTSPVPVYLRQKQEDLKTIRIVSGDSANPFLLFSWHHIFGHFDSPWLRDSHLEYLWLSWKSWNRHVLVFWNLKQKPRGVWDVHRKNGNVDVFLVLGSMSWRHRGLREDEVIP